MNARPAYFNEHDPFAAAWLRELIADGHIASGHVDERSIVDVRPADLVGYGQCHFFAGIGGWSLALRMAGVPDDEPVWTGSCPCQPFSAAGKRGGFDDARHLWPDFFRLIAECRPAIVFGEQVASRDGLQWLDLVSADLEGADYAFGAVDTCAAGFGAPHIRQRLWWVGIDTLADTDSQRLGGVDALLRQGAEGWNAADHAEAARRGEVSLMADTDRGKRDGVADGQGCQSYGSAARWQQSDGIAECGRSVVGMDLAASVGRPWVGLEPKHCQPRPTGEAFWSDLEWLPCRDGKARPTQPGLFPLAHGVPGRVGLLRGAGNAISPPQGAAFIEAVMGSVPTTPAAQLPTVGARG